MSRRTIPWFVLLLCAVASAQPPASQPFLADPGTPIGAIRVLEAAMEAGDVEKIRAALYFDDPKLVDVIAESAAASAKLRQAAVDRFGQEKAQVFGQTHPGVPDALDQAIVEINQDRATVTKVYPGNESIPASQSVTSLIKVNGAWRMIVEPGENDLAVLPRLMAHTQALTQAMNRTADQIARGHFVTADEARNALQEETMKIMPQLIRGGSDADPAANNPSTQPGADVAK